MVAAGPQLILDLLEAFFHDGNVYDNATIMLGYQAFLFQLNPQREDLHVLGKNILLNLSFPPNGDLSLLLQPQL